MTQKDLFDTLVRNSELNIAGANLSLASALTLSTNSQIDFEYNKESGIWTATGELPPPGPTVELVDLGLSVKWAKYNVGATGGDTPESWYGNYYAWGEISDKRQTQSGYGGDNYAHGTYTWDSEEETWICQSLSKYNTNPTYGTPDGKTTLEATDDVATAYNSELRMPTAAELDELSDTDKITATWTNDYEGKGVSGYTFVSKVEGFVGNTLFIPAAGHYEGSVRHGVGMGGIWAASLFSDYSNGAYGLYFHSDGIFVDGDFRFIGWSVRGVKP